MSTLDELTKRVFTKLYSHTVRQMRQRWRESLMFFTYPVAGLTDLEFRLYYRIPANEFYAFKRGQVKSILHSRGKVTVNVIT